MYPTVFASTRRSARANRATAGCRIVCVGICEYRIGITAMSHLEAPTVATARTCSAEASFGGVTIKRTVTALPSASSLNPCDEGADCHPEGRASDTVPATGAPAY